MKYVIAIDAGTGSVRSVIFDQKGNQISQDSREWEHKEDPNIPGSMDFDYNFNYSLTCQAIKSSIEKAKIDKKEIVALSSTSMREAIVLYNKKGEEIFACANVDARSSNEVLQLKKEHPNLEKELYMKTGETFPLSAIPRLLWIKNNLPDVYKNVDKIGMINDWIIYKLSGTLAIEPSNGSTSGFFDLKSRNWDKEIAKKVNLRDDIFPSVIEPGEVFATVSKQGALDSGLYEGLKIVMGGGDAQLGCVGVGCVKDGEGAIFGGSFWQYEYNTSEPKMIDDCSLRVNAHAIKNMWQYEALAFTPGLVLRWYRDAFCEFDELIAAQKGSNVYSILDEKASQIPVGSYGMLCSFSDIMNFISWKHAAPTFSNFDLDAKKYNRYTFYRSILENTAYLAYGHLKLVEKSTKKFPSQITFAAGASKSDLWCRILADVLGIEVVVPIVKEATALGCAMLAMVGVGLYENLQEASKEIVKIEKVFKPKMENHKIYMQIYEKWREVYKANLALSDRNLQRYMWKAPGA